jgi:mRNA interferase MazF
MSPQPGEVWLADLGLAAKTRPVVIVSRQDLNPPALWCCMCPSRRSIGRAKALQRLPFLDRDSVANVQGLGSVPTVRLERKIGRLSSSVMAEVSTALVFALDLESASG